MNVLRLQWRSKRTRHDPLGDRDGLGRETVYACAREELAVLLGVEDRELRQLLRRWRDEGLLVHDEGRLTKRVAFYDSSRPRAVRHHRMVILRFDPCDAPGLPRVRPLRESRDVTPPPSPTRTGGRLLGRLARDLRG